MIMQGFLDSTMFTWVILPILIFFARIVDMSFDTMRVIMVGRGRKVTAALMGFFEVCIWLLVARQVIAHLPNVACFFAYALGFATGNYVGMVIEERMAVGFQLVRVITDGSAKELIERFRKAGHGVTCIPAQGMEGDVEIVFTIVPRKDVQKVVATVRGFNPDAFCSIEDVRDVKAGIFPSTTGRHIFNGH
jgi:uncharacterized protein YebE (UPF0316 family)